MLLQPMLRRLRAARGLGFALEVALADVLALHGAERGNIQLFDRQGQLAIVRQFGLPRAFLELFARVAIDDGTVCGRAALQQRTIVVADVQADEEFRPFRHMARAVPFTTVLSSPLLAPGHGCIGVVSVHFANRFTPSTLELQTLEAYCAQLAQVILEHCPIASLPAQAESFSASLLAAACAPA